MYRHTIPEEKIIHHIELRIDIEDFRGIFDALRVADDYLARNKGDTDFRGKVELLCKELVLPEGMYQNFDYKGLNPENIFNFLY